MMEIQLNEYYNFGANVVFTNEIIGDLFVVPKGPKGTTKHTLDLWISLKKYHAETVGRLLFW